MQYNGQGADLLSQQRLAHSTAPVSELAYMSDADLLQELKKSIALTAQGIAQAARVWAELERRGYDLSSFRESLKRYLPLVAKGRLIPEAVVEFMADPLRLKIFSTLSLDDQRVLLQKGEVKMLLLLNGEEQIRDVKLGLLSVEEAQQVFDTDSGVVRSPQDQKTYLDRRSKRQDKPSHRKTGMSRIEISAVTAGRLRKASDHRRVGIDEFLIWLMERSNV